MSRTLRPATITPGPPAHRGPRDMSNPHRESISISPPGHDWPRLMAARATARDGAFSSSASRAALRVDLGLPSDVALIATGHQAQVWHAGILAKYFAAEACRARVADGASVQARAVWIVVDQDTNDPADIAYPAVVNGRLRRSRLVTLPASPGHRVSTAASDAVPARSRVAFRVSNPADAHPEIATSVGAMVDMINRYAARTHAAAQLAAVLEELLSGLGLQGTTVFASDLRRTRLFAAVLDRIHADPEACISAYNAAVSTAPEARIARLAADPVQDRFELPLWRLTAAGGRERVYLEDLPSIPRDELAPRALLLTGLMRLAGCDLFIHGVGGGVYDHITERWFARWLPTETLSPTAVVTATRFLPLARDRAAADPARARWLAHHARHNPGSLGDDAGAARKAEMLRSLRVAPKRSAERAAIYRLLHADLERVRTANASALRALDALAADAVADAAEDEVIFDRTFPFPLLDRATLDGLNAAIRAEF